MPQLKIWLVKAKIEWDEYDSDEKFYVFDSEQKANNCKVPRGYSKSILELEVK